MLLILFFFLLGGEREQRVCFALGGLRKASRLTPPPVISVLGVGTEGRVPAGGGFTFGSRIAGSAEAKAAREAAAAAEAIELAQELRTAAALCVRVFFGRTNWLGNPMKAMHLRTLEKEQLRDLTSKCKGGLKRLSADSLGVLYGGASYTTASGPSRTAETRNWARAERGAYGSTTTTTTTTTTKCGINVVFFKCVVPKKDRLMRRRETNERKDDDDDDDDDDELIGFVECSLTTSQFRYLPHMPALSKSNFTSQPRFKPVEDEERKRGGGSEAVRATKWRQSSPFRPVLANLCVDERWRRRGLGGEMMTACERWAALQWGCDEMLLQVEADNDSARRFYENLGYQELFRDRAARKYDASGLFLRNVRTSRITMWKDLSHFDKMTAQQRVEEMASLEPLSSFAEGPSLPARSDGDSTSNSGAATDGRTAGAVVQVDVKTGGVVIEEFESLAAAQRATGLSEKRIRSICDGVEEEQMRVRSMNFRWKDEEDHAERPSDEAK